jgi:hypothetical protein
MEGIKTSASYKIGKESPLTYPSPSKSLSNSTKSSLPLSFNTKTNSLSELKSDENSTELCEEDIDEECDKKSVANFQKNYLELGQWPEVPVPVFQAFKNKYRGMKEKLKDCKCEKEKVEEELRRYKSGEIPCKSCSELREKNSKTKIALEQAVQLSHMLLRELKRLESRDSSISE